MCKTTIISRCGNVTGPSLLLPNGLRLIKPTAPRLAKDFLSASVRNNFCTLPNQAQASLVMKFSTPTLLAILASTAVVQAAPASIIPEEASTQLVKKSDVEDALAIIQELGSLNQKRELIEDENELMELSKRADSLLAQLISALANSGIIKSVWTALTSDTALRSEIIALVKKAFSAAVTYGPSLIKAVYNSGIIQKFFSAIWNDAGLRSTLFSAAKAIFSSGLNLLKAFLATKTGGTTAASTPTAAAKREAVAEAISLPEDFDASMYIDKRDLLSTAESIVTAIKNTGIVQSLVQKVLADPQQSISFLETVFSKGLVVAEDIYDWSKNSGILQSGLNFLSQHGPTFSKAIATFLGEHILAGNATVADIDNAASVSSATTVATTAATPAAATTLVKRRLY